MIIKANAKINLTLDIIGRRADGYHLIDSVFQSIGLFDTVTVEKSKKISVLCAGIGEKENIAFKAAAEFFKYTGITGGTDIKIDKNIPVRAGLGGGSADAAAVIIALNGIYNTALSKGEMAKIALKCGADVPFFIYGGTARVGGVGERVEPLSYAGGYYAVLIKAGEKQSTADMYNRLDAAPVQARTTERFLNAAKSYGYSEAFVYAGNAFSSVAADKGVISAMKEKNPILVSLSGSGPVHFAVFGGETAAKKAAKELEKQGYTTLAAPFCDCGAQMIE